MLGFVQSWIAPKSNPIGVDFGSDCLRMAQVQVVEKDHRLIAAASADVPSHVRHDPAARIQFFVETTRDLLAQGRFHGRRAVLSLPAASMFVQHLRMNKMDDADLQKALPWEARGKLPIDPSHAILRHMVAGEIYQDQEPKLEVIVMAAAKELINQYLSAASRAKLDIVGMNVEPRALVDCFGHVYRRKSDAEVTSCLVDIGCTATRAVIARAGQILFARIIPIGGDHFNRAAAAALKINFEDARILRVQLAQGPLANDEPRDKQNIAEAPASPQTDGKAEIVEQACAEPLTRLIEELDRCRRYYEATFPNKPVDRLIFVGGEARQRMLCQQIARQMSLAAQLGDPLVRMSRTSEIGIESGIDRRQPQPGWAVAVGLSMGPVAVPATMVAAA
jgi:type IV pilus assembly protein PilM